MDVIIFRKCPNCKGQVYSERIIIENNFKYPPFRCDCGWSEQSNGGIINVLKNALKKTYKKLMMIK